MVPEVVVRRQDAGRAHAGQLDQQCLQSPAQLRNAGTEPSRVAPAHKVDVSRQRRSLDTGTPSGSERLRSPAEPDPQASSAESPAVSTTPTAAMGGLSCRSLAMVHTAILLPEPEPRAELQIPSHGPCQSLKGHPFVYSSCLSSHRSIICVGIYVHASSELSHESRSRPRVRRSWSPMATAWTLAQPRARERHGGGVALSLSLSLSPMWRVSR